MDASATAHGAASAAAQETPSSSSLGVRRPPPDGDGGTAASFDDILSSLTASLTTLSTKEPSKEDQLNTFIKVLDIAPSEASFMLSSANYDLAKAVSLYLEITTRDSAPEKGPSASRRRVGARQDKQIEIEGLPLGWMALVSSTQGTVYFMHIESGVEQAQVPPGLLDEEAKQDPDVGQGVDEFEQALALSMGNEEPGDAADSAMEVGTLGATGATTTATPDPFGTGGGGWSGDGDGLGMEMGSAGDTATTSSISPGFTLGIAQPAPTSGGLGMDGLAPVVATPSLASAPAPAPAPAPPQHFSAPFEFNAAGGPQSQISMHPPMDLSAHGGGTPFSRPFAFSTGAA